MQLRSQRGSAVVFFGLWFGVLMLMLGIVLDGGRLYMTREQMRSALDAAALAGALQFEREVWVRVPVKQVYLGGSPPRVNEVNTFLPVFGDRDDVWVKQGYLSKANCVGHERIKTPGMAIICHPNPCISAETLTARNVENEARSTLALNAPWIQGADFEVQPANGTVIARGHATVNLRFMRLVGLDSFEVKVSPAPMAQLVPPDKKSQAYCPGARVWG